MKKIYKNKKSQRGKTPTQPKRMVELTEQDLEQVQGGLGPGGGNVLKINTDLAKKDS
jgi:hypothetical protein